MQLHVDQLSVRRGGRLVLQGVDFRLSGGTVLVLRGPNGVGKSTLLRVLAGLLAPDRGEITLGGVTLGADRAAYQEHLAYAGHLDAVKPALTVADNLALWAAVQGGQGNAMVGPVLERFGLAHAARRPAAECSAGQRRRLGLARLMLLSRPLWLLDEPTVSLDTEGTALVASMIEAHIGTGGMAVVATHIDLGVKGAGELTLAPVTPGGEGAPAADPFLEGHWA